MLRAIAIYEIIDDATHASIRFSKTDRYAPKSNGLATLFSINWLDTVEEKSLPQLNNGDLTTPINTLHFSYPQEHHYVRRIPGASFLMVICSKKRLDPLEAGYLMTNIQHTFLHAGANIQLDDILMNPLGYTNRDHLLSSTQAQIDELKKTSLDNINKLLERGEKIDKITGDTALLLEASKLFKQRAEEQAAWCRGCR